MYGLELQMKMNFADYFYKHSSDRNFLSRISALEVIINTILYSIYDS